MFATLTSFGLFNIENKNGQLTRYTIEYIAGPLVGALLAGLLYSLYEACLGDDEEEEQKGESTEED